MTDREQRMNRRRFAIESGLASAALLLSPAAMTGDERKDKEKTKNTIDKLMMFSLAVSDMPAAKSFYADQLGFKIVNDHRIDDSHWWVSVALPEGGASITLTTVQENMKPGTMKLYFTTSDIAAAHQTLNDKGVKVKDIKDDLFGPGSGVKWFQLADPDGNQVLLVQPKW